MPRRKENAADPIVRSPSCPRCGYDLTGVVESWSEQCPVEGVCSECGFGFAWRDLLVESRRKIPWLYEHRRGPAAGYAIEMIPRALLAHRFWQKVQLHHRPNVTRLILFPFVAFFVLWFGSVLLGIATLGVRYLLVGNNAFLTYTNADTFSYLATSQFGYYYEYQYGFEESGYDASPIFAVFSSVGFSFGIVLSMLIARSSRRISKVSSAHVLRAFSYGLAMSMLLYASYAALWLGDRIGVEDTGSLQDAYPYLHWGYAPVWVMVRAIAWSVYLKGWVLFWATLLWLMLWWWCAMRYGFRLVEWKQVYVAGLFLGFLFALSIDFFGHVWLLMMW